MVAGKTEEAGAKECTPSVSALEYPPRISTGQIVGCFLHSVAVMGY